MTAALVPLTPICASLGLRKNLLVDYQEKKQSVVIPLQSEFCSDIICDNFLPNVEFVNR